MKVFLDSCVWIGGIKRPNGFSGAILQMGLSIVSSEMVFEEVRRNLSCQELASFEKIAATIQPKMIEILPGHLPRWKGIIDHEADFHILEGATKGKAGYLLSLDNHILNRRVRREMEPIKVLTPEEFIETVDE